MAKPNFSRKVFAVLSLATLPVTYLYSEGRKSDTNASSSTRTLVI